MSDILKRYKEEFRRKSTSQKIPFGGYPKTEDEKPEEYNFNTEEDFSPLLKENDRMFTEEEKQNILQEYEKIIAELASKYFCAPSDIERVLTTVLK